MTEHQNEISMQTIVPLMLAGSKADKEQLDRIILEKPDYIELRLDGLCKEKNPEDLQNYVEKLIEGTDTVRFIYTIRTRGQGGEADLDQAQYEKYIHALSSFKGLLDIELPSADLFTPCIFDRAVISYHDFEKTPDDKTLSSIWKQMKAFTPYVEKIAVMPQSEEDVERLLDSCKAHKTESKKIAISMSALGVKSRIEGDRYGSSMTFCTVGEASAPGQISLAQFRSKRLQLS
jgi:3-dehydroquinate dehydratase-1